MADAPVLPFEFRAAAKTYRRYTDEVEKLAQKNDTTKGLDLSAVRAALGRLDSAAAHYEAALAPLAAAPAETLRRRHAALAPINHMIAQTERALTDTAGLPNRPWYQHLVYAPGFYTGYGVKTLPGIREAVEQRRPAEAQAQAARVAAALDRYAAAVERASAALAAALR